MPVTVITAREDINYDDFIKMGFKAYIKKPISISDLKLQLGGQTVNFGSLNEMLENDPEALQEVLISFINSTRENIANLRIALLNNEFKKAQSVCHKMIPMLIQVGAIEKLDILKKIDALRFETIQEYPGWEDDILEVIEYSELIIDQTTDYLTSH